MNAKRDGNNVPTLICALDSDGITPTLVFATSNYLDISDGTTGSDHGTTNAQRDGNFVPVLIAVSSADGSTPVEVYANSSNQLLTKST